MSLWGNADMNHHNAACSPFWLPWQVTHKLWVPIIKLLPKSWWDGWLEYGHTPFATESSN